MSTLLGPAGAALLLALSGVTLSFAQNANSAQASAPRPALSRALTTADIAQAIAFGTTGSPAPYELHYRGGPGLPNRITVALVYTPFVRVALAARAATQAGRVLTGADLPAELTEPIVHIAFRWFVGIDPEAVPDKAAAFAAANFKVASAADKASRILGSQRILPPPPLWTSPGVSALRSFAGKLPYDDLVLVAAYPVSVLQPNVNFIIFKEWPSATAPTSLDGTAEEGLVTAEDVARWR